MLEENYSSNEISNEENILKTPIEIKQIIEQALVSNGILGYLNNATNCLYMKSFGRDSTPDKIMISIGFVITYLGLPGKNQSSISQIEIIMIIAGIIMMIVGGLISKVVTHYLVYDIDREVFYTISNLFNKTIFRSKEVAKRDIIELGVDVTDRNEKNQIYQQVIHPKGVALIDNPGLKTSFVALKNNGKKVNISDPVALKQPHEAAVARCQLFSECFGVPFVICNKNEALKIVKDNNVSKFEKFSKEPEWEKARKEEKLTIVFVIILMLVVFGIIFTCI